MQLNSISSLVNKISYALGAGLLAVQLSGSPAFSSQHWNIEINQDVHRRYYNEKKADYISTRENIYSILTENLSGSKGDELDKKIKYFAKNLLNSIKKSAKNRKGFGL